jgi:hypothetical protein
MARRTGPSPMGTGTSRRLEAGDGPSAARAEQTGPAEDGVEAPGGWMRVRAVLARVRLEYVFLVIALVWGIPQVFLVPPLQVPDEEAHWFRAWAMTEGQITAGRDGTLTLPAGFGRIDDLYTRMAGSVGYLTVSLDGQPGFSGYADLFNAPASGTVKVVSRVANYSPIGYLPQAVGIGLGRLVGASPLTCFYLARLANLLAAVTLLFFAIRLAPFGKQLYVLLALLPMTMFELASASCDALTLSGAIFFTALVLWAGKHATLRAADVAAIVVAAALLLTIKPGYWAIVLLVLLVRPPQLGGRGRYWAFAGGSVAAVAGATLLIFLLSSTQAAVGAATGPHAQLLYMSQHPLSVARIFWDNFQNGLLDWTLGTIGTLGWLTISLPQAFSLFVLVAGLVFFMGMEEETGLQLWRRAVLAGVAVVVFLTLAVALYVFLEPAGSPRVFFQGRYLTPVWLLLLLSAYGVRFVNRYRRTLFIIAVLVVIMAENLHVLLSRYHP